MRALLVVAALLAGAVLASAAFVVSTFHDVAATRAPAAATYAVFERGLRESVEHGARDIAAAPADSKVTTRGLALYRAHCVQCHGAPGVAPEPFALGMVPVPVNLAYAARAWRPAELYWIIKHGVRWSGMPAWQFRMSEDDLWAVTAFVGQLAHLTPQAYQRLESAPAHRPAPEAPVAAPSAARGRVALTQYGCLACHHVPGVAGPDAPVGPPLAAIGTRGYIAGVLPNTTENMIRWLRAPQAVNPRSAMPDLGVTERDARDITAFLQTLK